MISLGSLKNTSKVHKGVKRVGRGPGSGKGKTCGRGEKGAGSRSGYKRRYGYEGGQFRTFMKLPIKGFSNAPFSTEYEVINLAQIDTLYADGETVSIQTLKAKGYSNGRNKLKVLGNGELKKKVSIEAHAISDGAREKLARSQISVSLPE